MYFRNLYAHIAVCAVIVLSGEVYGQVDSGQGTTFNQQPRGPVYPDTPWGQCMQQREAMRRFSSDWLAKDRECQRIKNSSGQGSPTWSGLVNNMTIMNSIPLEVCKAWSESLRECEQKYEHVDEPYRRQELINDCNGEATNKISERMTDAGEGPSHTGNRQNDIIQNMTSIPLVCIPKSMGFGR